MKEKRERPAPKGEPPATTSKSLLAFDWKDKRVRMVVLDSAPWWVGKDVCEALGYENPARTIGLHCKGVPKRYPIVDSLGRTQQIRLIGEPDLFRLITQSRLPAAQEFERLVFEEILPEIRRTGGYFSPFVKDTYPKRPRNFLDFMLGDEKEIARKAAAAALKVVKAGDLDSVERLCRYYEGKLTYPEIAVLMGVTVSTVGRWIGWCCDAGMLERRRRSL